MKNIQTGSGPFMVATSLPPATTTPAQFDSDALKGNVVYVSGDGHVDLAIADGEPQALAIGLATADTPAGMGEVITNGPFTNEAWSLTPGTVYYLSPTVPGGITSTFPDATGNRIVIVGAAITPTQINVAIHWVGEIGT